MVMTFLFFHLCFKMTGVNISSVERLACLLSTAGAEVSKDISGKFVTFRDKLNGSHKFPNAQCTVGPNSLKSVLWNLT